MGYWYWRPLKTDWVLDEATSNKFTLPERGYLSGLALHLQDYNETDLPDYDNPWPMQRTTIRVVGNGNVEIDDVRGRQLQALNFWDSGQMPEDVLQTGDAHYVDQYAYIPFGRWLGDPKYGLVLEKFDAGVEFEETNTFSTTYYTDAYSKFDIYGLFRKNPEPGVFGGGFFRKRQIINKDTASETQYGVKLPTKNKLRQIHMFSEPDISSHVPATTVFTNLQTIWLGVKSKEEYIIDNMSVSDFARIIHDWLGRRAETAIYGNNTSGGTHFDTQIYERLNSILTPVQGANYNLAEAATTIMERIAKVHGFDADAGTAVNANFYGTFHGICYHGDLPLLLVPPDADEEAFLDADAMKDVYVEFTEGASTGNVYIVLDELQKTYPS